jgi:hypothetical protein
MDVDARADVFSLGVVTFELLTGRLPWASTTDLARLARIMVERAIKVHELSPDVPNTVAEAIDDMLELKADDRIASARIVHDRVVHALSGLPEGVLDTIFTRDPELLSNFVREDTRDIPGPPAAVKPTAADPESKKNRPRRMAIADLKTEGVIIGRDGNPVRAHDFEAKADDVQLGRGRNEGSEPTKLVDRMRRSTNKTDDAPKERESDSELETPQQQAAALPDTSSDKSNPTVEAGDGEVNFGDSSRSAEQEGAGKHRPRSVHLEAKPRSEIPKLEPRPTAEPRGFSLRSRRSLDEISYVESTPATLLFGRVQEIEALKQQVVRSLATEKPSLTTVVGPAGIGKTRVRVELAKLVRATNLTPRVLSGRAEESARTSPFAFLSRLVLSEARIRFDDPPAEKHRKVLELLLPQHDVVELLRTAEPPLPGLDADGYGLSNERTPFSTAYPWADATKAEIAADGEAGNNGSLLPAAEEPDRATVAAFLCVALRIPTPDVPSVEAARGDPRLMGEQVRRAFDVLLRGFAAKAGLAVLVDDAHVVDQVSAEILVGLTHLERGIRAAVVAFGLPTMQDPDSPFRSPFSADHARAVELSSLDARASREFARSLVKGLFEASALEHLVKRAAGNPLYLEQLVRAVLTNGVLQLSEDGEFALVGLKGDETDDDRVPPTVAAAVAARMSRMNHEQQKSLTAAAVFGEVFWVEGVARLLEQEAEEAMIQLDVMQVEGMVRRRSASRYLDQTEMEFCHSVIRSVALSRLKRKRRHRFERGSAEYLRAVGEDDESQLAVHLGSAGRRQEAAELYMRAAESSVAVGSFRSGALLAEEGLRLSDGTVGDTRRRLLDLSERIAVLNRDFVTANDALEELEAHADTPSQRALLHERRSRLAFLSHRFLEAEAEARRALELRSAMDQACSQLCLAEAAEANADGRTALRAFIASQSGFSAEENASGMSRATRGLARVAISSGDYRSAESRFRESLVHAHSTRDAESAFLANLGLSDVARMMGHPQRARELLEDAARFAPLAERHLHLDMAMARILMEEAELAEAKKKLDHVYVQTEGRPELEHVRRLAALYGGQLLLLYPPSRPPPPTDQLGEAFDRLAEALSSAIADEPQLVLALQSAHALVHVLCGRLDEARMLDADTMDRFMAEGAVNEEEPPRVMLAHARIVDALSGPGDELRNAWKRAVEHLDNIAGRLNRTMRQNYFARGFAQMIVQGAEASGLKLRLNANSNRIAATDS